MLLHTPALDGLDVKGELIVQPNQGILTRSRSKKSDNAIYDCETPELTYTFADPDQFTSIPFKAKALKILLKELEQSTEPSAIEAPIEDDDAEVWRDSVVRASPR